MERCEWVMRVETGAREAPVRVLQLPGIGRDGYRTTNQARWPMDVGIWR